MGCQQWLRLFVNSPGNGCLQSETTDCRQLSFFTPIKTDRSENVQEQMCNTFLQQAEIHYAHNQLNY